MIYSKNIEIPTNTEQDDPSTLLLNLCYGIIRQIDIGFPAGCHGLVGIKLKRGLHSLFPVGEQNWFTGDDVNISFDEQYMLLYEPFHLSIEAYNLDDTYNHTIVFRIGVELPGVTAKITNLQELSEAVF